MKHGQTFPSKASHFQYVIRTCKMVRLQKLVRIEFVFEFFKLLKNEESLPFSAKSFDRNFKCSFKFLIFYFPISQCNEV